MHFLIKNNNKKFFKQLPKLLGVVEALEEDNVAEEDLVVEGAETVWVVDAAVDELVWEQPTELVHSFVFSSNKVIPGHERGFKTLFTHLKNNRNHSQK